MADDYDPAKRGHWLPTGRDRTTRRDRNLHGVAEARLALLDADEAENDYLDRAEGRPAWLDADERTDPERMERARQGLKRLECIHGIRPVCMTPEGIAAAEARIEAEHAELRVSLGLPAVSPHSPEGIRAARR